jgi:tRNA dimethylallyltransferase
MESAGLRAAGGGGSGPIPVPVLFGPTASGKTEILTELFGGGDSPCPAEVVSADSMQVYRGMDIGTAKPSPACRALLPHHLIDIRNPDEQFNAGEFVRLAAGAIRDIAGRGKLPVVSGGTGFYLLNLVLGLPEAPPSDPGIRETLRRELRDRGAAALAEELAVCDPLSAGRIHINDEYRLLRALEVFRLSGRPLSSFSRQGADPRKETPEGNRFRFLLICLERPREEVYRRIGERCARMFREGLPGEVRRLWEAGYGPAAPGMRAIGYREFFVPAGDGSFRLSEDPAGVEVLVARNSRRYAKRQLTYFASIPGLVRIGAADDPVRRIRRELAVFLENLQGRI